MAVTKTLTGAVPYNKSSKVQQWDLEMQYNQGSKSASQWDDIFASQYDSVITNPPDNPVPDPDYVIPS